jgi:hypothetical protein
MNYAAAGVVKKAVVSFVAAPLSGYLFGQNVIAVTYPIVMAVTVGHQIELPFTVAHADQYGSRCPSPVELLSLPFLFDRVCHVRSEFRRTLAPGARIVAIGLGTNLGVFAEDIRRID